MKSAQKYGGLPALASANPERIAKIEAMIGCSSSRNGIGPVTRAAMLSTTRVQKSSMSALTSPTTLHSTPAATIDRRGSDGIPR